MFTPGPFWRMTYTDSTAPRRRQDGVDRLKNGFFLPDAAAFRLQLSGYFVGELTVDHSGFISYWSEAGARRSCLWTIQNAIEYDNMRQISGRDSALRPYSAFDVHDLIAVIMSKYSKTSPCLDALRQSFIARVIAASKLPKSIRPF